MYGENSTVRRNATAIPSSAIIHGEVERNALFQSAEITQKGVDHRPLLHFALAKSPLVKMSRRVGMRAYAAIVGTPEQEINEVNATLDGRIVQSSTAPTYDAQISTDG